MNLNEWKLKFATILVILVEPLRATYLHNSLNIERVIIKVIIKVRVDKKVSETEEEVVEAVEAMDLEVIKVAVMYHFLPVQESLMKACIILLKNTDMGDYQDGNQNIVLI